MKASLIYETDYGSFIINLNADGVRFVEAW